MHYVSLNGLGSRIGQPQENYPDWYLQARNTTRATASGMAAIPALQFSVAAFLANWNRLGHPENQYTADLTGWVKRTMQRGHMIAVFGPGQSTNQTVDSIIRYAVAGI